ncbi:hypothetical protein Lesp02_32390 [Lentzea sp. NBRC 105346]|uniref:hypothetical protein n=1 Tax=Lentzea sp. NBRC 105346 TaxID=3032205 RepID=UPI0024A3D528|nr:hypothetical protein [Lentzea sp. NBRC 105346]GLZ31050.1 hypothetical protein Lesp02_32390 [Lentzea sp. NBRC 105346]
MMITKGADDPRLRDVDNEFREVLTALLPMVRASVVSRRRFFHPTATTLRGTVRMLDSLEIPDHTFFRPGRQFSVLARYSNGFGTDDIAPAVRGLTLRFTERVRSTDGVLDLLLNTGECFYVPTADAFRRVSVEGPLRDELLRRNPHYRDVIWRSVRRPASFATYHYYSQAPSCFVASDSSLWFARYRVVPTSGSDRSAVNPSGMWMPPHPPNTLSRDPDDRRPRSYLHDDLRYRVTSAPVTAVLQIQLHPGDDPESTLDCTRPWAQPWHDLGEVSLDRLVDNEVVEGLRFSPATAPPELGIALARTPHENASLNHLRALVYHMAASARLT